MTLVILNYFLGTVFLMTFFLIGFKLWSTVLATITVIMFLIDLMGLMYLWDISLNALSLVNLCAVSINLCVLSYVLFELLIYSIVYFQSIGIAVEFVSHIVRWFAYSDQPTRKARAHDALVNMGSSVFSGITLTKFFGILVLAFSKSQIFEVS